MVFDTLRKTLRHHGGVLGCIKSLIYRDALKHGTLVGTDRYGNRYYENTDYFMTRNRWVEYADHVGLNYDASQVPAEWFGWLHHRTDLPPHQEPFRPQYDWMLPHEENMSGSRGEYVPYTTTKPVILPWVPPKAGVGMMTPGGKGRDAITGGAGGNADCSEEEIGENASLKSQEEKSSGCGEEEKKDDCEKPAKAFH